MRIIRPDSHFGFNEATYKADGAGDDGNEADPFHEANQALSRRMWEVIQLHYPGHPLTTGANHKQGVCMIYFPIFTTWPYILKIANLKADPGMKRVVKAAGEILERYRMPRAGFDLTHLVNAMNRFQPKITQTWQPPE